jgi:hypothetical protein
MPEPWPGLPMLTLIPVKSGLPLCVMLPHPEEAPCARAAGREPHAKGGRRVAATAPAIMPAAMPYCGGGGTT